MVYRLLCNYGMSREVALWLLLEIGAFVIPNIPCSSKADLEYITDGIEDVTTVAFSTKGRTDNPLDIALISASLDLILRKLHKLKAILVYDTSTNNKIVDELFKPAREMGIDVIVPSNSLKHRNIVRGHFDV